MDRNKPNLQNYIKEKYCEVKSTHGSMFMDWTIVTRFAAAGLIGVEIREINLDNTPKHYVTHLTKEFLSLLAKESSNWFEHAQWRAENRGWLKHSQKIAIKVLSRLSELNITKEQLSKETNIPLETINNIVKGKENLTLENISKLEVFLQINLLSLQIN